MHDAQAMGVSDGVSNLEDNAERVVESELFLAFEKMTQRLPLDVRHDVVEQTVCFT